jgi:hypothetical protein
LSPGIRIVISSIALAAGFALLAGGREEHAFHAGPASEYAHQTAFGVTIGAKPFDTEDLTADAFGKKTPLLKYGVLPVLVVVENKGKQAIDLRPLKVNLVGSDGRHVESVNPEDIQYLRRGGRRTTVNPLPVPLPSRKNPLNAPQILTRAFTAGFVAPGDSVSGFFYFEARLEPGDHIYLDGMAQARSGQPLMYFEFPLQQ